MQQLGRVMSRQGLRSFLREASAVSEKISALRSASTANDAEAAVQLDSLVNEARKLVSSVSLDVICADLPDSKGLEAMSAPMFYADVYQSSNIHVCLFGFKDRDFVLPLHDHPDMYGFVKVLRGAVSVSSFSDVPAGQHKNIKLNRHQRNPTTDLRPVRYEGQELRWSSDDCIYLGPFHGNLHSIAAVEDGTTFFDLLIPGYRDNQCTYYEPFGKVPKRRHFCYLQKIPEPEYYYCEVLPYEPLNSL